MSDFDVLFRRKATGSGTSAFESFTQKSHSIVIFFNLLKKKLRLSVPFIFYMIHNHELNIMFIGINLVWIIFKNILTHEIRIKRSKKGRWARK